MKKCSLLSALLLIFTVVLTACDPGTPLGNLMHKPRTYVSSASAENKTNQPMSVTLSVSEGTSENACDSPYYSKSETRIDPGQKGQIATALHCAKSDNWMQWTLKVSADGFYKEYGVSSEWVEFSVSCVQGSCDVHANCHGGGSSCGF